MSAFPALRLLLTHGAQCGFPRSHSMSSHVVYDDTLIRGPYLHTIISPAQVEFFYQCGRISTASGTDSEVVRASRFFGIRLFCVFRRKSDNEARMFTPILFRSAFNRVYWI